SQHLDDPSKRKQTKWGVAQWIDYRSCEPEELAQLESAWTRQYRMNEGGELPAFNKVNPPFA
ncbi:MAG: hypothetical protein OXH38_11500, partial [Chloroflexi bacterium]|nr:hypothetical protein [Chloroflexota bacterium]